MVFSYELALVDELLGSKQADPVTAEVGYGHDGHDGYVADIEFRFSDGTSGYINCGQYDWIEDIQEMVEALRKELKRRYGTDAPTVTFNR